MPFDLVTFVFEIVNFLVLGWVLHRLLYRPLREGVERRREAIASAERTAIEAREEAAEQGRRLELERIEVERQRERALEEGAARGAAEAQRLLDAAREEASALQARVKKNLAQQRGDLEDEARRVAVEEGARLAGDLLARWAPDEVDSALVRALADRVRELGADRRWPAASAGGVVEVAVARPLADAALQPLQIALASVGAVFSTDGEDRLSVVVRPELKAGARLQVGSLVMDASLRGHLEGLRAQAEVLLEEEVSHAA